MQKKYRMYIDEVGNADLKNALDENLRYLSLTGVILSLNHVKEYLSPSIESLKEKFFESHPDEPVILHRKEIVNQHIPFQSLRDDSIREEFNKSILELFSKAEYTVITVVIDKQELNLKYEKSWKYEPYHYCLAVLLERYALFLKRNNFVGDVMAESRGGKEDTRLKKSFKKLYDDGTDFIDSTTFQKYLTSCELKIKPKKNNIAGLQLCDLLAHPSRREILLENNKMSDNRKDLMAEKICKILETKYDKVSGKVYGKKLLP